MTERKDDRKGHKQAVINTLTKPKREIYFPAYDLLETYGNSWKAMEDSRR